MFNLLWFIVILFGQTSTQHYNDLIVDRLTVRESIGGIFDLLPIESRFDGPFRVKTVTITDDYTVLDDDVVIRFVGDEDEANTVITLPDATEFPGRVLYFNNGTELHTHTGGVTFETISVEQNALYPVQVAFRLYDIKLQDEAFPYLDVLMTWADEIFCIFPYDRYGDGSTYWMETVSSDVFVNHAFTRGNSQSSATNANNFRLFPLIDYGRMLFWHHNYSLPGPQDSIIMMSVQTLPTVHTNDYYYIKNWTSLSNPRFSHLERNWGMYGAPDSLTMYTVDSLGILWLSTILTDSLIELGHPWKAYRQVLTNVGRFTVSSTNWGTQFVAFQTFDMDSIYLYNVDLDTLIFIDTVSVPIYPQVITEYIDGSEKIMVLYHNNDGNIKMKIARSWNGYPIVNEGQINNLIYPYMDSGWPACEWKMLSVATAIDPTTGNLKVTFPCNADDLVAFNGWTRAVEVPFNVYQHAPVIARRNLSSEAIVAWFDSDGLGPYTAKVWFLDAGQGCILISDGFQWSVLVR